MYSIDIEKQRQPRARKTAGKDNDGYSSRGMKIITINVPQVFIDLIQNHFTNRNSKYFVCPSRSEFCRQAIIHYVQDVIKPFHKEIEIKVIREA